MSGDSSSSRYQKTKYEHTRSKKAEQDVATSSGSHRRLSDISREIELEEIPHPSRDSAPQAEVNLSESQVKDEEGTNKSFFTKIFECFVCSSKSNLPEEVKRGLGRRFNIDSESFVEREPMWLFREFGAAL